MSFSSPSAAAVDGDPHQSVQSAPQTPATTNGTATPKTQASGTENFPVIHESGDVIMEGWLEKKGNAGIKGMRRWKRKYVVLFRNSSELRYYSGMVRTGNWCSSCPAQPLALALGQGGTWFGFVLGTCFVWTCSIRRARLYSSGIR
jgi:hypothetical protein